MIKTTTRYCFLFLLALFVSLPAFSFAESDATLSFEPKNPSPNSSVTVTLVSYVFDVDTALITWTKNGKVVLQGVGEKKITVQTGGVGYQTPLHVHAVTGNNSVTDIDVAIVPQSVDILYEAEESYTPPFYKGKALPGEGSAVTFTAIPSISEGGRMIPSTSLAYSWYVNDVFMGDSSGMGKSSAIFNLDFFSAYTRVKVVARSVLGTSAEKYIDVYPHDVMPLFYLYDDILGVNYTSAITQRFETTKDFTLALEPFYFSTKKDLAGTASYTWLLDGLPITPLGGRLLSMHPKENSYGSRVLSITLSNSKRRLQEATTDLNLIFDTRN